MSVLSRSLWPPGRAGEALVTAARRAGLRPRDLPPVPAGADWRRWIEVAAPHAGLEAEPVDAPYAELDRLLEGAAPGLLRLRLDGEPGLLAVVRSDPRGLVVVGPDGVERPLTLAAVRRAMCGSMLDHHAPRTLQMLARAGVPEGRRERVLDALLTEQLGQVRIPAGWLVRLPPGAPPVRLLRQAGLHWPLLGLLGLHTLEYLLFIASWWLVGAGALSGRFDWGWLLGWGLLLLTLVPMRLATTWFQGTFAIGAGSVVKARLLLGALRLEPDETRHQGSGQLLGRVMESEAVETLALNAGFAGVVALIELAVSVTVLVAGAGGALSVLALLAWVGVTGALAWRAWRAQLAWTTQRLAMTDDLVERMVGHRTRLAQEPRDRWHDDEDPAVARYLELSQALDRASTRVQALVPRGWLLLGLGSLAPAFVAGADAAPLAVGVGGVMLALRALGSLSGGLGAMAGAAIAWRQIGPLYHAAARPQVGGAPVVAGPSGDGPLLAARDLVYRYRPGGEPAVRKSALTVQAGERLLLEGPSGGGKTTFASLLTGIRRPESGLLLLGGLDRHSLGEEGWRRRVCAAPQFHENHVIAETFAFNLLMGRQWPPGPGDLEAAEAVCRELGLGELVERMPGGMMQMVGETGWQLSHGEKSRLFIARALLQNADMVVLDESFAALDPANLRRALLCVLQRAPTLLVIAHP